MTTCSKFRHGITAVDLLAMLVIFGVMLTLFTPVIQMSREQSRSTVCVTSLRMLGLAMHNYHDVYRSLPAMRLGTMAEGDQASVLSNRYCASGLVSMLPFIEQARLFDTAQERNFGPVPWRNAPDTWAVQISLLLCNSDQPNSKTATGNSSYKFNIGTTVVDNHSVWGEPSNGVFTIIGDPAARGRTLGLRHIIDGTSNTVAMSERRIENHRQADDIANVAITVAKANSNDVDTSYEACWKTASDQEGKKYNEGQLVRSGHGPGERWADGRPYFAGLTTIVPPNGPSCLIGEAHGGPGVFTASSRHPGYVNVLICDGSVREVTDEVDRSLWAALGTRGGREDVRDQIAGLREGARLPRILRRFAPKPTTSVLENPPDMSEEDEEKELKQLATENKRAERR
jgi:prepilin-type processing-associated H-X9-DG protein